MVPQKTEQRFLLTSCSVNTSCQFLMKANAYATRLAVKRSLLWSYSNLCRRAARLIVNDLLQTYMLCAPAFDWLRYRFCKIESRCDSKVLHLGTFRQRQQRR